MADLPVNKVAQSGLITLDLETYLPEASFVHFDLKDYLFQGLILREKDFRAALKAYDWAVLKGKILLIYNTADAIIPMWAYMLITSYAAPHVTELYQGDPDLFYDMWYRQVAQSLDLEDFRDKRIVIKGCGSGKVPASAYAYITRRLHPVVKSVMFGEPCSTVPIYKALSG